jgi:hypothetical protein
MHRYTLEELKQRRIQSLLGADQAIRLQPATYQELKQLLKNINDRPLDVADYYKTAVGLSTILRQMADRAGYTIFDYFADHIDPGKQGDVRSFRLECRDLAEQIKEFDLWRVNRRMLKRIK